MDAYGDVQANGEDVARIASDYEHAPADAALIAAAPELLDVLLRLERFGKIPKVSPLGKRVRSVIAKALQVPELSRAAKRLPVE